MIKEYCDICGKEKRTCKYKLPVNKKKSIKNIDTSMECEVLIPVEKDICVDCASLIGYVVQGYSAMKRKNISGFDVSDGNGVHIIGEKV